MILTQRIGHKTKNSRLYAALFLIFFASLSVEANQTPGINTQLSTFLSLYSDKIAAKGFRSQYSIGRMDPRLSSGGCSENLQFSFNREPTSQSNVTVRVECKDEKPWKLYVNVLFEIFGSKVVANEMIPRGTRIESTMLTSKEDTINNGRHNTFSSADEIVGMLAKRTIREGTSITPRVLKAPNLVRRGDKVVIIAKNSAISIKMNGTALSDGVKGQQISIRNNQSKRIIRAKVVENGRVLVTL